MYIFQCPSVLNYHACLSIRCCFVLVPSCFRCFGFPFRFWILIFLSCFLISVFQIHFFKSWIFPIPVFCFSVLFLFFRFRISVSVFSISDFLFFWFPVSCMHVFLCFCMDRKESRNWRRNGIVKHGGFSHKSRKPTDYRYKMEALNFLSTVRHRDFLENMP